jgi:tRNA (cmo5U34)-methyltransferase
MIDPLDDELYLSPDKDDLFAKGAWPKPFVFDEAVVQVFDDMVSRSVPLYREALVCAVQWAIVYHQPHTQIMDVGCSTGTFLELLGRFLKEPTTLVGIDNSAPMLAKARKKLAHLEPLHQIELVCASAQDCSFAGSSVVVMNYTLQFLALHQRQTVLQQIYEGLAPGGLLFLSEKVASPHPRFQEMVTRQYEFFKARNGYAETEIERKKEALENVLIPLSEQQQVQMLNQCGFVQVDSLIKLHNFVSWVALK